MIHDLDMILSFNLGAIEDVRAAGVPVLSSTIDIANARITFESGCVANLTASRVSRTSSLRELRLFQRDAYFSVDYQARCGMIYRRRRQGGIGQNLFCQSAQGIEEEPLKLQLASFVHAVFNRHPRPSFPDMMVPQRLNWHIKCWMPSVIQARRSVL